MSLVVTVACKKDFVIVSGDKKRVSISFDKDTLKTDCENIEEAGQDEKVFRLTDKVLIGKAGIVGLSDILSKEMFKRVSPGDDLRACTEHLENVINELHERRKSLVDRLFNSEEHFYLSFLDKGSMTSIILSGFNDDGYTGFSIVKFGDNGNELQMYVSPDEGFRHSHITPSDDYDIGDFFAKVYKSEIHLNGLLQHIAQIHTTISYVQSDLVSPDFDFKILYRDEEGNIQLIEDMLDTSEFHKSFESGE